MEKQQFSSRWGFILAAMGSAIGLGNIWRFPAVAYDNGGGAFIIPYLFALLTAGIPLVIFEFAIGNKYRGSAPECYAKINKKAEWVGWWQVLIAFFVTTYYSVVIAWLLNYTLLSFNLGWGSDTTSYFINDFLQLADVGEYGGIVPTIGVSLAIIWVACIGVMLLGVQKGIEKIGKVFIPLLIVLFSIVVVYSVTLNGAGTGLNTLFTPDWAALGDPKVWIAAYGQIFFSLSICSAVMITYSSYTAKKSEITSNAIITSLGNASVELLAGIGIFSALGFMATNLGVGVNEVVAAGPMLLFASFTEVINQMPAGVNVVIAVLFFVSLVLAGFSSLISLVEVVIKAVTDKFKLDRTKAVLVSSLPVFALSFIFATRGGLNFLDTVDYFLNNYGFVASGLVEILLIAYVYKKVDEIVNHANATSEIKLGKLYKTSLTVVTPGILLIMLAMSLYNDLTTSYSGYPLWFNVLYGWTLAIGIIVIGLILGKYQPKDLKNVATEGDN